MSDIIVRGRNTTGIWPPGIVVTELRGSPQPLEWKCHLCLLRRHGGRGTYNMVARHSVMHHIEHHMPRTWRTQGVMPAGILPGSRGVEMYLYAVRNAYLFTPEGSERSQPGDLPTISA